MDGLQKLPDKCTVLQMEEMVKLIANSSKSYEEIVQFMMDCEPDKGKE